MPEQVGQGAVVDGDGLGDLEEPDQLEPVQALGAGLVGMDLGQPGVDGRVGWGSVRRCGRTGRTRGPRAWSVLTEEAISPDSPRWRM